MVKFICALLLIAVVAYSGPKRGDFIPPAAEVYRAQLTREAHMKNGLQAPVAMFAAQIHQESHWNTKANSEVGALGLAQFMPATAGWIARLSPADLKPAQAYDAGWAIRALVTYDTWLYKRLTKFKDGDDRWAAALAAYNGGLGYVQKDQRAARCDSSVWFGCVDSAPDVRTPANIQQNRQYPVNILHRYRPLYVDARW